MLSDAGERRILRYGGLAGTKERQFQITSLNVVRQTLGHDVIDAALFPLEANAGDIFVPVAVREDVKEIEAALLQRAFDIAQGGVRQNLHALSEYASQRGLMRLRIETVAGTGWTGPCKEHLRLRRQNEVTGFSSQQDALQAGAGPRKDEVDAVVEQLQRQPGKCFGATAELGGHKKRKPAGCGHNAAPCSAKLRFADDGAKQVVAEGLEFAFVYVVAHITGQKIGPGERRIPGRSLGLERELAAVVVSASVPQVEYEATRLPVRSLNPEEKPVSPLPADVLHDRSLCVIAPWKKRNH